MTLSQSGVSRAEESATQESIKMPVDNPRFPHYCRIIRKVNTDPLTDEEDFSPLGEEYNPLDGDAEDGQQDTGQSETAGETIVVYEGECRSYAKNTTSDKGEVITSYRGLALPITEDGWKERDTIPQEGDEIAVDHGSYIEYGRVIDRLPANFHGTHLTWRYGRN